MKCLKYTFSCIAVLLGATLVSGCTTSTNDLVIQSKFAYPNGDYSSVGHVKAEKKYTTFFSGPEFTRQVFQELHQQALATQPNADAIVNYAISSEVTMLPMVPVNFTTFSLEGTAIKLEAVKDQFRRDSVAPPPTKMNPPTKMR